MSSSCCSSSGCSSQSGCCSSPAAVIGVESGCSEDVPPIGFLAEGFILPPHLEMKRDHVKGRGLFFKGHEYASASFTASHKHSKSKGSNASTGGAGAVIRAGEVLFREKPRLNFQFTRSCKRAFTCFHCARFLGNLSKQMKFLTGAPVTQDENKQQAEQEKKEFPVPFLPEEDAELSEVVPCEKKCGIYYCSKLCRSISWSLHHRLLCVGVIVKTTLLPEGFDPVEFSTTAAPTTSAKQRKQQQHEAKRRKIQQLQEYIANNQKNDSSSSSSSSKTTTSTSLFLAEPVVHPLVVFQQHASTQHEYFLLAAQAVASIICQIETNTPQHGLAQATKDALEPWLSLCRSPWWEVADIDPEDDIDLDDEDDEDDEGGVSVALDEAAREAKRVAYRAEMTQHLQDTCRKSYALLRAAIFQHHEMELPSWFTFDFYSRMIGSFRLNNIAIEIANPLRDYFAVIDSLQGPEKKKAIQALAPNVQKIMDEKNRRDIEEADEDGFPDDEDEDDDEEDEDEDEEDDEHERRRAVDEDSFEELQFSWTVAGSKDTSSSSSSSKKRSSSESESLYFTSTLFPSFHGSGIYDVASCMNHSCEPNASVEFEADHTLLVLATQDIHLGEEISISYIDTETNDVTEREQELKGYQFTCQCDLCKKERKKKK